MSAPISGASSPQMGETHDSIDGTSAVVNRFPPPVRVCYQENQGAAVARNRGLAEASGDVFAFPDADDPWRPHQLEVQLRALEALPSVGWVVTNLDLAEALAADLDYVRVDLYNLDERIFVGEMTLYPASGFGFFSPQDWDLRWGTVWDLPEPTRSA